MPPDLRALGASLHFARPADDHRHADAAFIKIAFDAAQRTVAVEEIRIDSAFFVRPVITGKDHDRVLIDPQLLQTLEQSPDVSVHPRYHRRLALLRLGPVFAGELAEIGYLH